MTALPDLPGPKLRPFHSTETKPKIDFIEHIATGADATIWKVSIDGDVYALKIFFYGDNDVHYIRRFLDSKVTKEEIRVYADAFNSECRAYGRLQETGNEHLSIKCYGHVLLTADHEKELAEKGDIEALEHDSDEFKDLPLRAIVKEFVPDGRRLYPYLDARKVPQMIRDLDSLHRIGIFIDDVRDPNYLRDLNVDFSRSKTVPHPLYNRDYIALVDTHPIGKNHTAWADEVAFDSMIDEYNEGIERGRHNGPYIWTRMKGRTTYRAPRYNFRREKLGYDFPRVRPELYDWEGTGKEQKKKLKDHSESSTTMPQKQNNSDGNGKEKNTKKTKARKDGVNRSSD